MFSLLSLVVNRFDLSSYVRAQDEVMKKYNKKAFRNTFLSSTFVLLIHSDIDGNTLFGGLFRSKVNRTL
jgi:hypothetical protein